MPSADPILSHGGDHGSLELVRPGMGRLGHTAIQRNGRCGVSQCDDYPHERDGSLEGIDCVRFGVQHRDNRRRTPALPLKRSERLDPRADLGVRLQRLVAGSLERPLAARNRHPLQRRSAGANHEKGRVLVPAPQTHDERQARRSGVSEGWAEVARSKKKQRSDSWLEIARSLA
jgi:hypothetical protein